MYSIQVATIDSNRHTREGLVVALLRRYLLCLYVPLTVNFYRYIAYRYLKMQHVISNNIHVKYINWHGNSLTCDVWKMHKVQQDFELYVR